MDRVRKTFFNPLATTKQAIRSILQDLPVGSAHPYSPEKILLCRTENGIKEIDISKHPESYFYSAVDLGEMGEVLLKRMAAFNNQLKCFEEYAIQQAPSSTFRIPINDGDITMFAISERTPTYYDFCFANAGKNCSCWNARTTFRGLHHSGDHNSGNNFLAYVKMTASDLVSEELCVFISGYQNTPISRFLGTHPAVLVANHRDKVLYIIPVPLDKATIGESTLCCPLVIKKDGSELICSILATATTDVGKSAAGDRLDSRCFAEAIARAEFSVPIPQVTASSSTSATAEKHLDKTNANKTTANLSTPHVIIAANSVVLPASTDLQKTQIVRFGSGIEFVESGKAFTKRKTASNTVLPCILGDQLEGPLLLATGTAPLNLPFLTQSGLHQYYEKLQSLTVFVDDQMTDNARNLASSWRLNAVFVVQIIPEAKPRSSSDILKLLDNANINAVTALAGPQSVVLIRIHDKYFFYRGIANKQYLDFTNLAFGTDITEVVNSLEIHLLLDPRVQRLVNLADCKSVLLVSSGQFVEIADIVGTMADLPLSDLEASLEDITSLVPQLQVAMDQQSLQELSKNLINTLSTKISREVAPLRDAYIKFLTREFHSDDPEHVKRKAQMLGELRKTTLDRQKAVEPVISSLSTMMSAQTTSKRTHDLKRLLRQAQISGNVEAAKNMNWETLAGYLETYAADVGVLVVNINTQRYEQLLGNVNNSEALDASAVCSLDPRILYLSGFDAGFIIEASQSRHDGPLTSQNGPLQPILALSYLSQDIGSGSMIAWACWDEFVNLKSPYSVRWLEKCNESHIAAVRILTRSTLTEAVASRAHNFQSNSPQIGNLMFALLSAAMRKLAEMRTTAPKLVEQAEDTTIKLMRGLFGNFLTIAGSGVRPLSMVWQMFGLSPQYDVPNIDAEWEWYRQAVMLYPYTGWPLEQFYKNLEILLDKVIIRVVTKGENVSAIKEHRMAKIIKFCKLRNIELEHSRTIITVMQRMLTDKDADVPTIASRLLTQIPSKLEKQSYGYTRMVSYLQQLSKTGERHSDNDRILASIYTKRSAAFAKCKSKVLDACRAQDWTNAQKYAQALVDEHAKIATVWNIDTASFKVQNIKAYNDLLAIDLEGANTDDNLKEKFKPHLQRINGDAECKRIPWQIGKSGQFGPDIEPLDEGFVHEMLTGGELTKAMLSGESTVPESGSQAQIPALSDASAHPALVVTQTASDEIISMASTLDKGFVRDVSRLDSVKEMCRLMCIPEHVLKTFAEALAPADFVRDDIVDNFREVIVSLLKNRVDREKTRPAARLFGMVKVNAGQMLAIEEQ